MTKSYNSTKKLLDNILCICTMFCIVSIPIILGYGIYKIVDRIDKTVVQYEVKNR